MSNKKSGAMVKTDAEGTPLSEDVALVSTSGAAIITRSAQATDFDALADEGFAAEVVHTLKEGEILRGFFLGAGGPIETTDDDGVVTLLRTWRVRPVGADNVTLVLLGSAQLNRFFGGLVEEQEVYIRHLGDMPFRGKMRVNQYELLAKPAKRKAAMPATAPVAHVAPDAQARA